MKKSKIKYWIGLILFSVVSSMGMIQKQVDAAVSHQQPLRVLFIGNSYTYVNDLPWLTQQLSISARETRRLETEMVTVGGATLKSNWERGEALKRIQNSRWDYVVLQEQSTLPISDPKVMYEYARLFDAEIKRVNARTVFYLTWARENRPQTQQILTDSYMKIAKELGAEVAPVGLAWQKVQEENPKLNLYYPDQSHPSPIGSYVAACVFYAKFYEKNPVGLSRRIYSTQFGTPQEGNKIRLESLSEIDAAIIQNLAWYVVSKMWSSQS
ncbi:MAG: SGNH/GDSL hydrolase family protein [Brasilonema angustatum HA4187-MV1]|jgi:hypothetical protein|nr:SGNH/GDSL hydrolase family protein [Brasilonema angustatum HA4187-MV1]